MSQTKAQLVEGFNINTSVPADSLVIDSSGRLLVGTSSAVSTLNYAGGDRVPRFQVFGDNTDNGSIAVIRTQTAPSVFFGGGASGTNVASGNNIGGIVFTGYHTDKYYTGAFIAAEVDATPGANDMPGRLVFSTTASGSPSPVERWRINSNGMFTSIGANQLSWNIECVRPSGSAQGHIRFVNGVSEVGYIATSTTNTTYATSSDYRLKENVTAVADGITRLQQLKPSRFNFIADPDTVVDGFIAHEVQAVVPEAITGEKDEVDDEGNPIYQGIDQSKMVPLVVAALQECIKKVEALEAEVANLKAQ